MELTEFLLARIAEDEGAARAVAPLAHNFDMGGKRQDERFAHRRYSQAAEDGAPRLTSDEAAAAHFARHDPARVLAECTAKRRIVDAFQLRETQAAESGNALWGYHATGLLIAIRHLATAYADHPDYDPQWQL